MSRREKNKKRNSLLKLLYIDRLRRRKRRLWSYEWPLDRKNKYAGASNLLKELEKEQPNEFINFVRMTPNQFHYLVNHIKPIIRRKKYKLAKMYRCGDEDSNNSSISSNRLN